MRDAASAARCCGLSGTSPPGGSRATRSPRRSMSIFAPSSRRPIASRPTSELQRAGERFAIRRYLLDRGARPHAKPAHHDRRVGKTPATGRHCRAHR
eukprot:scaffold8311_cov71-Phaeocystis_antarctica.AAC.10